MTKISLLIPSMNRDGILEDTLHHAIDACRETDAEILVIDDSPEKKIALQYAHLSVTVLQNPKAGAAAARNFGARHAKGDLLLFIDDDIRVSAENLRHTLSLHARYPDSCFNFNWVYPRELKESLPRSSFGRFLLHTGLFDYKGWVPHNNWNDQELFPVDKLAAFYFSISRKAFLDTGGFDENFSRQGVEDDEFSLRLRQAGYTLYIDPTQTVYHNEKDKVNLRNRLNRLKAGALNKRKALDKGMEEYRIAYSPAKRFFYRLLSIVKKPLLVLAESFPNAKWIDPLYRKITHLLIGTVIYEGYWRQDNRMIR